MTFPFEDLLYKPFSGGRTGGPEDELRVALLTRLARDLSQYYLCYACLRLHLWRHIGLPAPNFMPRKCFDSLEHKDVHLRRPVQFGIFPTYSFYQFHFVHLHLAMRRFYFGPSFGIPAESLMYTEVAPHALHSATRSHAQMSEEEYQTCHRIGLVSVDARVCPKPPSLCLRTQELVVARRQNVLHLLQEGEVVRVCMHIGSHRSNFSDLIKSLIETYRRQDQDTTRLSDHGKCDQCNTAWKLELRELGEKDICLVLMRWIDLGPGLSPEDHRWRIHLDYERRRALDASDMSGDPRLRFEINSDEPLSCSSEALSDEEMYLRNVSLLRARRYQTVMKRWGPGWWFLHGKEDEAKGSRCIVI